MNKNILILICSLLAVSCSRPKGEASSVSIEIPEGLAQKSITTSSDTPDLEIANPTSLSSFNCIAIGVGAADLSHNTCGRLNETTNEFDGTKDIKFGPWSGTYWLNGLSGTTTIIMEVPTGAERTFYAFGVRTDEENCRNLTAHYDKDKASKIFLLGTSSPVKLETGKDDPVKITLGLNSNQWVDTCRGPTFDPNKDSQSPPSQIKVTKISYPSGSTLDGACERFEYHLVDKYHRLAPAPSNFTFKMFVATETTPQTVYTTPNECVANTGTQTDITIETGTSIAVRWTKITRGTTGDYTVSLTPNASQSLAITPIDSVFKSFTDASLRIYKITGPNRVLPNTCYDYHVVPKTVDGQDTGDTYTISSEFSVVHPTGATFYPDGCSGNAASVFNPPKDNFDGGYATFGLKFPSGDIDSEQTFDLVDESNLAILDTKFRALIGAGGTDPRNLEVIDRGLKLKRSLCRGPYFLNLLNENQTALRVGTSSTVEVKPESYITAYTSSDCSGSSIEELTVDAQTSMTKFYVKTSGSLPTTTNSRAIEFIRKSTTSNSGSGNGDIKRTLVFPVGY